MPKRNSVELTDKKIKRLRSRNGERREFFDSAALGLALRVSKYATVWVVHCRLHKKHIRVTLDPPYPDLSIEDARTEARLIRSTAKKGIHPKAARDTHVRAEQAIIETENEGGRTFESLARAYMERGTADLARPEEKKSLIEREIIPTLGDIAIADLRGRDLVRVVEAVAKDGRKPLAKSVAETAKRICSWGLTVDEITSNPFGAVRIAETVKLKPRDRVLNDNELKRVWIGCGPLAYPFGNLFRLLILTGARLREIAEAEWSEVDLEKGNLVIGADRTKQDRSHLIPLSRPAFAIVTSLPRVDRRYLFSTNNKTPVSGYSRAKANLDRACEVGGWRIHDLRRTTRTGLSRLGVRTEIAEMVIGHTQPRLHRTYDLYEFESEKRDALQAWSDFVFTLLGDENEPERKSEGLRLVSPEVVGKSM